ncbi:MAG: hypothetical protein OXI44_12385 [Bacteroidota bacterium]|nr:hypothetical protein [Bacteroidota bacterium]
MLLDNPYLFSQYPRALPYNVTGRGNPYSDGFPSKLDPGKTGERQITTCAGVNYKPRYFS